MTIQLTSLITQRTDHDLPPKGKLNKGDYVGFRDLLLNRKAAVRQEDGEAGRLRRRHDDLHRRLEDEDQGEGDLPEDRHDHLLGPVRHPEGRHDRDPDHRRHGGFAGATGTVVIGAGETKSPNTYVVTVPHPLDLGIAYAASPRVAA